MRRRDFLRIVSGSAVVTAIPAAAAVTNRSATTAPTMGPTTAISATPSYDDLTCDPADAGTRIDGCEACRTAGVTCAEDLTATADLLVQDIMSLSGEDEDRLLANLKDECATLHALVCHKLKLVRRSIENADRAVQRARCYGSELRFAWTRRVT